MSFPRIDPSSNLWHYHGHFSVTAHPSSGGCLKVQTHSSKIPDIKYYTRWWSSIWKPQCFHTGSVVSIVNWIIHTFSCGLKMDSKQVWSTWNMGSFPVTPTHVTARLRCWFHWFFIKKTPLSQGREAGAGECVTRRQGCLETLKGQSLKPKGLLMWMWRGCWMEGFLHRGLLFVHKAVCILCFVCKSLVTGSDFPLQTLFMTSSETVIQTSERTQDPLEDLERPIQGASRLDSAKTIQGISEQSMSYAPGSCWPQLWRSNYSDEPLRSLWPNN